MLQVVKFYALLCWCWLKPRLKWVLLLAVGLLTLGLVRRRPKRPSKPMSMRDANELADALRPAMERRADEAHREAEQHRDFAEQRIKDAAAERERVKNLPAADVLRESEEYARKVRSRRGNGLLVLLCFLSLPWRAAAQTALPYQLVDPSTGEHGWYIPDDVWRGALADSRELEDLQSALPRFRQALAAKELESDELRRQVEFERAVADLAQVKLDAANIRLVRAGKWYRSPRFLVPLGIVLGGAVVLVPSMVTR